MNYLILALIISLIFAQKITLSGLSVYAPSRHSRHSRGLGGAARGSEGPLAAGGE